MADEVANELKQVRSYNEVVRGQLKKVIDDGFLKCVGMALNNAMAGSVYNMSNDLRKQLGMQ